MRRTRTCDCSPALRMKWAGVAVCLLMTTAAGFGQSTNSADLRGTVTDASGAVIPGVKVTIVNIDTGITTELTTNAAGIYDAVSIRTGKYRVTFTKEGFSKLVRDGITLDVGVLSVDELRAKSLF